MPDSTHTCSTPVFNVSADLPGLRGVPAQVGPVGCFCCGRRTATVRHERQGDGDDYSATLVCEGCGSVFDLLAGNPDAYATGLTVGILVEAARRGDSRVTRT
jgi:hypothetical protein